MNLRMEIRITAILKLKLMMMSILLISSTSLALSFAESVEPVHLMPSFSENQTSATALFDDCSECNILSQSRSASDSTPEIITFSREIAYRCEKTDDYIGRAIGSSNSEIVRHLASQPLQQTMIKSACTKQAMDKIILPGESFRSSCVSNDAKSDAPCVSQSYHQLMHNSLDLVSRCAKDFFEKEAIENKGRYSEVLQEILGKLTLESNFHLNAVSPTNYSGPGQLNYGSIEDVNNNMNAKDSMLNYLKAHVQRDCRELAPILEKKMKSSSGPCEKISLDLNHPIANLLYTFNYRMIQRRYLNRGFFDQRNIQDRFAGDNKDELYDLFKQRINTWAYNPGAGGMRLNARTALMKLPKGSIQDPADLNALMDKIFTQFTGQSDSSICDGRNRPTIPRMENGCYLHRLKKKSLELKDSVGGLSCINS